MVLLFLSIHQRCGKEWHAAWATPCPPYNPSEAWSYLTPNTGEVVNPDIKLEGTPQLRYHCWNETGSSSALVINYGVINFELNARRCSWRWQVQYGPTGQLLLASSWEATLPEWWCLVTYCFPYVFHDHQTSISENYSPSTMKQRQTRPTLKLGTWIVRTMLAGLTENLRYNGDAKKTAVINDEMKRINVDI